MHYIFVDNNYKLYKIDYHLHLTDHNIYLKLFFFLQEIFFLQEMYFFHLYYYQ
jgi:hypothetical protein